MCGFAGIITKQKDLDIRAMTSSIQHRGPDDSGSSVFHSDEYSVLLGHRRLSIIDLSPAGHQPMGTEDGRFTITYNGELYNFAEIKTELASLGHPFHSKTDTEVILCAHAQWSVAALDRFNGMFAYALWDDAEKKLLLVRDHAGQKPLYYTELPDGGIVFASEIKAILASGLVRPAVNISAIGGYLGSLRVHAPDTMFESIKKLPAGHWLEWKEGRVRIQQWWDPIDDRPLFSGSRSDAVNAFSAIFSPAVKRHMIADVPVGAFLSGGLDSSFIVALASSFLYRPLITFTTGFEEKDRQNEHGKNELAYSRLLKKELGAQIDYREIILKPNIIELLSNIVWHLDEPIADPAEINAYLICKAAREHGITVLLSGMGADEIFAGYNHHLLAWHTRYIDRLGPLGRTGITAAVRIAQSLPNAALARYALRKGRFLSLPLDQRILGLLSWQTESEIGALLADEILRSNPFVAKAAAFMAHPNADLLNRILYIDTKTFLPEHNLMYTDKMSMASSCEVRSPFLDREVMEFAFSLPAHYKINGWSGKDVVKRAAARVIPRAICYQRKSGFAAPIRAWKKELSDLAADHLRRDASAMRYFNPKGIARLVSAHATGKDASYQLWSLITFALWHERFIEAR